MPNVGTRNATDLSRAGFNFSVPDDIADIRQCEYTAKMLQLGKKLLVALALELIAILGAIAFIACEGSLPDWAGTIFAYVVIALLVSSIAYGILKSAKARKVD